MISIYKENDKTLSFFRKNIAGETIKTKPLGLWFTVRDINNKTVIQKSLGRGISQKEDGSWQITIDRQNTIDMKPGDYFCDVKVRNESDKEYTIIKPQTFRVEKTATTIENQEV